MKTKLSEQEKSTMIAAVSYNDAALQKYDAEFQGTDNPALKIEIAPLRAQVYNLQNAAQMGENADVAQCRALADIRKGKLYEIMNYKSVADFAADFTGLAKSTSHARAAVGVKFYDETTPEKLKAYTNVIPVASLERLVSVPNDILINAFESGVLNVNMGQKEFRAFVQTYKDTLDKPAKPVKTYYWKVYDSTGEMDFTDDEIKIQSVIISADKPEELAETIRTMYPATYTGRFVKVPAEAFAADFVTTGAKVWALLLELTPDDVEHNQFWELHTFVRKSLSEIRPQVSTVSGKIALSPEEYAAKALDIALGKCPDEKLSDYCVSSDNT